MIIKVRTEKIDRFTQIDNDILYNSKLSLEARGMLTILLSLPESWELSQKGIAKFLNISLYKTRRVFRELEENGHLYRRRKRSKDGRFIDSEYTIFEAPRDMSLDDTLKRIRRQDVAKAKARNESKKSDTPKPKPRTYRPVDENRYISHPQKPLQPYTKEKSPSKVKKIMENNIPNNMSVDHEGMSPAEWVAKLLEEENGRAPYEERLDFPPFPCEYQYLDSFLPEPDFF